MFEVDAISLDLDDTLWPVKPVIIAAERAMRDFLRSHYPALIPYLNDDALLAARRRAVAAFP
ncbi:MAG: HAD family hydrolase, partial [Pseudomonadota bacterium]